MPKSLPFCAALLLAMCAPLAAQGAPEPQALPDYGRDEAWLCRPGHEQPCTSELDAMVVRADGQRAPEKFVAAGDAPVDCFYVYPTVSRETARYAELAPSPEVREVARAQAGRLAARCRLFVPLYRQKTRAALFGSLLRERELELEGPYRDVLAAWRWYLAHDNQGRGVVLVGHSQGAILLQRLIAEEIDGKPLQQQLVSAFLAGDPALEVPAGARVGATFGAIPLCGAAAQTGCVYVWGSYLDSGTDARRYFGKAPGNGREAACVNPAAPGGGSGALKAYLPKPALAPAGDPPWVILEGQLSARCVADPLGNVLRVSVQDSPYTAMLQALLERTSNRPGWGLHRLDLSLTQGNILDLLAAQISHWPAAR